MASKQYYVSIVFVLFILSIVLTPTLLSEAARISPQGLKAATIDSTFRNESDKLSLQAFSVGISHDPFGVLKSWNSSLHFCKWNGITCSHIHQQRVVALNLSGSGLVGHISPFIANLTFLRTIDLSNNSFSGEIPQEIGLLFRLRYLELSDNSFRGEILSHLVNCSELHTINLDNNHQLGDEIPIKLDSLSKLTILSLQVNAFTGNIPFSLGNLSSLTILRLNQNNFGGGIPVELGRLQSLQKLELDSNELSGAIPPSIYNLSSIAVFDVAANRLGGTLPFYMGTVMPRLRIFYASGNEFTGHIPVSLSNASSLQAIDVADNSLIGAVPTDLGSLADLLMLNIGGNQLGSPVGNNDLDFLISLTNCSRLSALGLGKNKLSGILPSSIGNLTNELSFLWLQKNQIFGSIPTEVENLINLVSLKMDSNQFVGPIPSGIGKLKNLQYLSLSSNMLSGQIPVSLGNATPMLELYLDGNNFQGSIPTSFGNFQQIEKLTLSENILTVVIPSQVFHPSTWHLNLSGNSLRGSLPFEVGNLKNLVEFDVSNNKLSDEIPIALGNCRSLVTLNMRQNCFRGTIPLSFMNLGGLSKLDLSLNNLSGRVPKFFEKFPSLEHLNLSFNYFEGELPKEGIFKNASIVSVEGNKNLCGGIPIFQLPACPSQTSQKGGISHRLKIIIAVINTSFFVILIFGASAVLWCIRSRKKSSAPCSLEKSSASCSLESQFLKISYGELLHATDGFSLGNLIGTGSYGSVYEALLDFVETPVAVKVFNLQQWGALKSFMAECEALKSIRHRNLVKILTACSSIDFQGNDFKALVFEYMPNGSLEKWLHLDAGKQHQPRRLSLIERLNIATDVASAVEYLHHRGHAPLVHRDLKPSNILLGDDMTAYVSDFGLSRFLFQTIDTSSQSQSSTTVIKGTLGYVAPEYGLGASPSIQGDVYSYGIFLLEMFTGKRPTDGIFKDGLNLHRFAKMALQEDVMEIIDPQLRSNDKVVNNVKDERAESTKIQNCFISIVHIGVACSKYLPNERIDMKDVVAQLMVIRDKFLGVEIYGARQTKS